MTEGSIGSEGRGRPTSLQEALLRSGANLDPVSAAPIDFGDPARELERALTGLVLSDVSGLGRIRAVGRDVLDLLHRLTTADLRPLPAGRGLPAVLTSSKGRIVERIFVHHLGEQGVLIVTGNGNSERVRAHIQRFVFQEDALLSDETETTRQLAIVGPMSRGIVAAAGLVHPPRFGSAPTDFAGGRAVALGEDGYSGDGISVVVSTEDAAAAWEVLRSVVDAAGGVPAGTQAMEAWRILRGLPASGSELTEDHNPLEAGLSEAVSFSKGCYVGQEVVARLNTYDKVSRVLTGLVFPPGAVVPVPGSPVLLEGHPVGVVTSAVLPPGRMAPVALAYVKRETPSDPEDLEVGRGDKVARVRRMSIPFGPTP